FDGGEHEGGGIGPEAERGPQPPHPPSRHAAPPPSMPASFEMIVMSAVDSNARCLALPPPMYRWSKFVSARIVETALRTRLLHFLLPTRLRAALPNCSS